MPDHAHAHLPRKLLREAQDIAWVAELESGEKVVGRPSWRSSGVDLKAPQFGVDGVPEHSDWQRLKSRCESDGLRLKKISLFAHGRWFHAPEGRGSYGYFETMVLATRQGKRGVEALAICYPDHTPDRGWHVKVCKVYASGTYEEWRRLQWPACMIGPREFPDVSSEDEKALSVT